MPPMTIIVASNSPSRRARAGCDLAVESESSILTITFDSRLGCSSANSVFGPVLTMPNIDRINYLNIGLMIGACVAAYLFPFELFLFSYAVLGPLHYLTEISWLHERKLFH